MLMKFSDRFMEIHGDTAFDSVQELSLNKIVTYVINSKYRKAVTLKTWIKEQVENPDVVVQSIVNTIPTIKDADKQMDAVFKFVNNYLAYVGDSDNWNMLEYWQTALESINLGTGDCEDGAILIYVLARLKGIPANRLLLFAGWVSSSPTAPQGGHCYLGYKPFNYPLNYVMLDWCYYPTLKSVETRNKFNIVDKKVFEYKHSGTGSEPVQSHYQNIWFAFNEDVSFTQLGTKK